MLALRQRLEEACAGLTDDVPELAFVRLSALAVEGTLAACLDAIRNIQAQRPQNKRFDTNRILMYVWPPNELSIDELNALVERILPTTDGAGGTGHGQGR